MSAFSTNGTRRRSSRAAASITSFWLAGVLLELGGAPLTGILLAEPVEHLLRPSTSCSKKGARRTGTGANASSTKSS